MGWADLLFLLEVTVWAPLNVPRSKAIPRQYLLLCPISRLGYTDLTASASPFFLA